MRAPQHGSTRERAASLLRGVGFGASSWDRGPFSGLFRPLQTGAHAGTTHSVPLARLLTLGLFVPENRDRLRATRATRTARQPAQALRPRCGGAVSPVAAPAPTARGTARRRTARRKKRTAPGPLAWPPSGPGHALGLATLWTWPPSLAWPLGRRLQTGRRRVGAAETSSGGRDARHVTRAGPSASRPVGQTHDGHTARRARLLEGRRRPRGVFLGPDSRSAGVEPQQEQQQEQRQQQQQRQQQRQQQH